MFRSSKADGTRSWVTPVVGGLVDKVIGGTNVTVDSSNPAEPVVSAVDTVYDDTIIQAAVSLNTAKETNIVHPLVEEAVPTGALFTDTIYDDTILSARVDDKVDSITAADPGSSRVSNMVRISQVDYDLLTPAPNTLYVII